MAAVLFALFAGIALLWISLDRLPPNWDDAWYLTKSLGVYDSLTEKGVAGFLSSLNSAFQFKAPLIAGLPSPLYLVFGRHWHAAYLVNIVSMFLLFAALYRIGCRWRTPRAAVFAIAVTGTMPLLYGLERWYMVEYPLTAVVASAMAVLMESDSLKRPAVAVLFGTICGIGLMLKAAFGVFLFPAFFVALVESNRRIRSLMLVAIPCLAIALPWYAGHWRPVLANAVDAGFGTPAIVQGTGPIFAISTILTYLEHVARTGVSVYYVVLALALIAIARSRIKHRQWRFVLVWLLPFAVFLFGGNKDVRYIAPMLPAAALLIGGLLDSLLPFDRRGLAMAILLLGFPVLSVFAVSFGVPWHAAEAGYARCYTRQSWPLDEILRLIADNVSSNSGRRPLVLVGSDRAALNANNLELTAVALRLPVRIETTAHESNLPTLMDRLEQSAFFLYVERGEPESTVFNPHLPTLVQRVQAGVGFTELPYGKKLPDGGLAHLFRRSVEAAGTRSPPTEEFVVNFGGVVAITSALVERTPGLITARYACRQLQRAPREYWSFTHLVDPTGEIVAQLDRPIPLLEAGRVGVQRIPVTLPGSAGSSTLQLRFGLYDPITGVRLAIGPLSREAALRFKLADGDTALVMPVQ